MSINLDKRQFPVPVFSQSSFRFKFHDYQYYCPLCSAGLYSLAEQSTVIPLKVIQGMRKNITYKGGGDNFFYITLAGKNFELLIRGYLIRRDDCTYIKLSFKQFET